MLESEQASDRQEIWFLYLIRCKGGQLYTGITTDAARRFAEHEAGKGSKYLRGKGPLQQVFEQAVGSRSDALKIEAAIKKLSRADKEAIVAAGRYITHLPQADPAA